MTIDKNTWSKLSKKYPTKASWVRALTDLSWGEHDELFSALINLDIADLAPEEHITNIADLEAEARSVDDPSPTHIGSVHIAAIDPDKIDAKYDKVQDSLEKSEQALDAANVALARVDSLLEELSDQVDRGVNLHFHNPSMDDYEEIISSINRALDHLD